MSLDPEVVSDIAAELSIDPAFVEKDWHSVQVLKTIGTIKDDAITILFSGGTSLSKGHGLLKRFSEDLDFRAQYQRGESESRNRSLRRSFREGLMESIHKAGHINKNDSRLESGSGYFKFPLAYHRQFETSTTLRPELQIEVSFTQPRLSPEVRPIQSFVAQYSGDAPETEMLCLSPIEIGADKLSALTWRVLKRDRQHNNDDPAMIRHLHDLRAIRPLLDKSMDLFTTTAIAAFEQDQQSARRKTEKGFSNSMKEAYSTLKTDSEYEQEYTRFVDAMSYADDDEKISFKAALLNLEELVENFN